MARNTVRQGAGFELDVMHYLDGCDCEETHSTPRHVGWRGFGFDSARSSGSRGTWDVLAIAGEHWEPLDEWDSSNLLLIQCKISRPQLSPGDRRSLLNLANRAAGLPIVAWRDKDLLTGRVRPHFRRLTGTGPKDWLPWEPKEMT